jgi:MFS family permease
MKVERSLALASISIGILITFFASSIKGSYQVYFLDLAHLFGVTQGEFAFSGAIFGLTIGVISPVVGYICDRFGPVKAILSGAISTVVVFASFSFLNSYAMFILLYGVLGAYALAAMTFVPLGMLVDQVFSHKEKGMAYATITNGTAIGFMVLSPFWVWLNTFASWQEVSLGIAILFAFLITPTIYWLSLKFPKHEKTPPSVKVKSADQLLKLPFILMAASFAGCGASMAFIDVQLVPLMTERLFENDTKSIIIASTLSIIGAFELIGAFLVGWMLRFYAPALLLAFLYALRTISMVVIFYAETIDMFIIFAVVFGLTYMGTVIITSMMCLQQYGAEIKGKMFGSLFTVHQIAVFLTIWGGGKTVEVYKSYDIVIIAITLLCITSVLLSLTIHFSFKSDEIKLVNSPTRS